MRQTSEGKALGLDHLSPQELAALGTNGIQQPITRKGNKLIGTERIYADKFATADGRARFVARDQSWTDADPLAFLPEAIKPNAQYPFFVTTVRYQTVWQSGYTYRFLNDLARPQRAVHGVRRSTRPTQRKAGLKDGDWAEVRNQFSACEGVVNVSEQVPPGLISAIFGWQGPSDDNQFGVPRYYANNLVAGGPLQQKSNGAFFKNTRGALRKLDRAPRTAANSPGLSEKDRDRRASAAPARPATPTPRQRTSSPSRCREPDRDRTAAGDRAGDGRCATAGGERSAACASRSPTAATSAAATACPPRACPGCPSPTCSPSRRSTAWSRCWPRWASTRCG